MAFVYRSEKKPIYINQPISEVGPGSYQVDAKPVQDPLMQPIKRVPFSTTVDRNVQPQQESPGPGAYNIQAPMDGQKVIFQSAENEIKILEVPKPISVFKSNTIRFQEKKNLAEPGPGSYNPKDPQYRVIPITGKQRPNVIEELMKINKYQSIPSIPGYVHSFGYTENENNDLELNRNPVINHAGTSKDMVGPGSYQQKSLFEAQKKKGVDWKRASAKTKSVDNSFTSVGPGSYDPQGVAPMHSFKPQGAFTSKTLRSSDKRRGMVQAKHLHERFKQQSQSFNVGLEDDSETDSEYEFIEDATPGPGSYQYASTASTIASQVKSESSCPFGSVGERFKVAGVAKPSIVGPGQYNPQIKAKEPFLGAQAKPPFLSSDIRFDPKPINNVPGPTYYHPKNSMEEKLISTLQKAPLGSFGVNEGRFKDNHLQGQIPGPGTYESKIKPSGKVKQKISSSFQSQSQRQSMVNRNNSPPPGAYDQVANTIALACRRDEEDDPELAIQKPPFGVGEHRWKEPKKSKKLCYGEVLEEDEEDEPIQKSVNDLFKKKPRNLPPFNSRTRRFNYSLGSQPGPGEYHEGTQPQWNKRTFNIIFAEI